MTKKTTQPVSGIFQWFLHSEVSGSIVLLICAVAALVLANSPWAGLYDELLHTKVGLSWGDHSFKLSTHHWVNDFLMVIFFFVVGLEIKREVLVGELSQPRKAVLPVAAAVGGMVVPALLYMIFNVGSEGSSGWGIPMATDIAFALGVLALLGSRAPLALKVFLTALAIADDLGAVLVIALFYTEEINFLALGIGAVLLVVLYFVCHLGTKKLGLTLAVMLGVWVAVFASGVHATVAGILMALMIPVRSRIDPERFLAVVDRRVAELKTSQISKQSLLEDPGQLEAVDDLFEATERIRPMGLALEHYLHPVQAFLILPVFAFFNAGVPIGGKTTGMLSSPVTLGIVMGLVLGKPLGITLVSWLAVKLGWADLPKGMTWAHVAGAGSLAGIGFTMSLFISDLAFNDYGLLVDAKLGIVLASLVAGLMGYLVLYFTLPRQGLGASPSE